MSALDRLAEAVGLARHWRNANGGEERTSDAALAAVLGALGYAADSEVQIAGSLAQREAELGAAPRLITGETGTATALPPALAGAAHAELHLETGDARALAITDGHLPPIDEAGYHRLAIAGHEITLAIAPPRCFGIEEVSGGRRLWGPAVQIYALRGMAERPYGGFGELAEAAALFGAKGADALAISPVHALFPGCGARFSPYTPSSRLFLNAGFADPALAGLPPLPDRAGGPLIDWRTATPTRLADLRAAFAAFGPAQREDIACWAATGGEMLRRQALFDALYCRFEAAGAAGWPDWPAAFRDPAGDAVARFAEAEADEVAFHLFAQWLAQQGLAAAQAAAKAGGMALGLISDLAVGVDRGGADAWSFGSHMLSGLTIGAPPDPLGPEGQNWMLTGFSPRGLEATGFAPWIAMIRAALAHAGGIRIDHAFGLARLWVVPAGGGAMDGAYLSYPFTDLQRLIALESHRARAVVIAEDLGTAPWGFTDAIASREMLGMRVLWFEREWDGGFRAADHYDTRMVAMSGTHDTATVAGWWRGTDIGWNDRLGRYHDPAAREAAEDHRAHERWQLWCAAGGDAPQPPPEEPGPAVTAATAHVARTGCPLAVMPLEDILAIEEQPNIPGTIDQHPNWRRRIAAPLAQLLADPAVEVRIDAIGLARSG